MRNNTRAFLLFILLTTIKFVAFGQQPVQQKTPETAWYNALDYWEKEKFSAAQKNFIEAAIFFNNTKDSRLADCDFYSSWCALKLYNRDAEYRFKQFIFNHPDDYRIDRVYFLLGKYNFERKKYKKAISYFKKLNINKIDKSDISEYYYSIGYVYFTEEDFPKAISAFQHNNQPEDPFYQPATYYLAYIDYVEGNYEDALSGFIKIKDAPGFSVLVPYYVAQIYFLQKRYEELIEKAVPWYDNASAKQKPEMARLIGESYFELHEFEKALEYLGFYFSNSSGFSRKDNYAYAYTLYQTGKFESALKKFNLVINKEDELAQIALFNMGDCYLKTNNLTSAQSAFSRAANLNYNPTIKEEAFFNYAKLSYQLSFDPYDEAIQAFESYLDTYPNSKRKDDAYVFLLNVYLKTKNYHSALLIIEKIKNPDEKVKIAYQLSVYNVAVDFYLKGDFDQAMRWFQLVSKYNFDKTLLAEANFWQGEIKFKKKNFRGAIESYQVFLASSNAVKSTYYQLGLYGIAYAQLKLRAYTKAFDNFIQFLSVYKGNDQKMKSDASLRIGDIYFIQKAYTEAISYYQQAIEKSEFDNDYALFQIAMSEGYLDKPKNKINTLLLLISTKPLSVYRTQAIFELGSTYFEIEDFPHALEQFIVVEQVSPNSILVAHARLKRGLIYIKQQDNNAARDVFVSVITDYPQTTEANEALLSLKEVDVEKFTELARGSDFKDVSKEDVDAANFEEAEEAYLEENYQRASYLLGHYLNGFPNGRFRQNARYYKADSEIRLNLPDSALIQYQAILNYPGSPYYENALYMAAKIADDKDDFSLAYTYYKDIYKQTENKQYRYDALKRLMELSFRLSDYDNSLHYSIEMRKANKPDILLRQKALLIEIKSLTALDRKKEAYDSVRVADFDLRDITTAELTFIKAEWLYQNKKYKDAENEVYFLLQNFKTYSYWRAKGFILLGDIYVAMGDDFQAKATWKSVIEHHKGADLIAVAQQKLNELIASEEDSEKSNKKEIEMEYNPVERQIEKTSFDSLIESTSSDTIPIIQPVPSDTTKTPDNE